MLSSIRQSSVAAAVALMAWSGSAQGAGILRITEAMTKSSVTDITPDWVELTNYGDTAIDITGWRIDDNSFSWGAAAALTPYTTGTLAAWTTIEPGESVVFLETATAASSIPTLQSLWNLGTGVGAVRNPKLGSYSGSGLSLSSSGDGVALFSADSQQVTRVSFGAATTGYTFFWNYDSAGVLATAPLGSVSADGVGYAYTSGSASMVGSPGIATVAPTVVNLYWTANGSALGGGGSWDVGGSRWSPSESPIAGSPWANDRLAVFKGTSGTVTVNADVVPLAVDFQTSGYTLASGSGSVATSAVQVVTGGTATIAAKLTGASALGVGGGGTLVLSGTTNDYTGFTNVSAGNLVTAASHVIPDASRLTVGRGQSVTLTGFEETVNGFAGLGTIAIGTALTVNITGTTDAVMDGFLRGTGDLVIDSTGSGVQRLNTTQQTFNTDFAVKDYVGKTLVRRGGLGVDRTAVPINTTEVTVEAAGRLLLSPNDDPSVPDQIFTFGSNPSLPVSLVGGTIGQGAGDDVELANRLDVSGTSTVLIKNKTAPDPLNSSTEEFVFSGPLTGSADARLRILASDTSSGLAQSRARFTSPSGNTFAGTVSPGPAAVARFNADYSQTAVVLEGGKVDGHGTVKAVSGSGIVSPDGTSGPDGILTVGTISPEAGMSFTLDLMAATSEPDWSNPTVSRNDVLRITGSSPFTAPLASANVVRLFVGSSLAPVTLAENMAFQGGFFTTNDQTASIADATYVAYIYGDGQGTDIEHGGSMYYTLANYNTKQSTSLSPTIAMIPTTAGFVDGATSGYVMQTTFSTLTASPTELTWYGDGVNVGGSGTWTTSGVNWFDGTAVRTWVPGAKAVFSGTSASVVTVAPGVSADGGLEFSSGTYSIGGSALTLGGTAAEVQVASGASVTMAVPVAGAASVVKTGGGTLAVAAATTFSGGAAVEGGVLQVSHDQAVAGGGVTVGAAGTLKIDPGVTMRASTVTIAGGRLDGAGVTLVVNGSSGIAQLVIASGSVAGAPSLVVGNGGVVTLPTDRRQTLAVSSLTIDQAGGGKLDIGKGRIDVAVGGTTEADLRADVIAGRAAGTFSGTSGIMTTGGSVGTAANAAIGYRLLPSGAAVVAWAAIGDTNLDGQVNLTDVNLINTGGRYGKGAPSTWAQGDFNYNGSVTLTDINQLNTAGQYAKGSYLPVAPMSLMGMVIGGDLDGQIFDLTDLSGFTSFDGTPLGPAAAVPEPATWALVVAGAGVLAVLRRKTSSKGRNPS